MLLESQNEYQIMLWRYIQCRKATQVAVVTASIWIFTADTLSATPPRSNAQGTITLLKLMKRLVINLSQIETDQTI